MTERRPSAEAGALYYWDYLGLDALLSAQQPRSDLDGEPAHDELLFIVVHQAYELWFKQILHELDEVVAIFSADVVPAKEMGRVVDRLRRVVAIQRLLLEQLTVLETMTPLDFLDFRDALVPASGFQSVQFRLIENRLGLDAARRLQIHGAPYTAVLSAEHAALLADSEAAPSLRTCVDRWLSRTPYLRFGTFDFWSSYAGSVEAMLDGERATVRQLASLTDAGRAEQLEALDRTADEFATLFDAERYEELRSRGQRHLSQDAFLAALLLSLYRDEPLFQLPFRLLTALVEIDEGFTTWRQRHALMVHRMIGGRTGTGGTSGHAYLAAAARRHRVFGDLFDLPTFLLPRSALPALPDAVAHQLRFASEAG
ncbi:Tryptophan 2,3-dioxygenase [Beutenbergia cavernae DSM 12333]|uniref:Tryptophan 2,3-dioxygenase n=1 Tax=Beutenbergia cavernae (strain ATCC BAA-8 / DSM 12333 / CCUG 43141 / JCM 11478 / NBRC 16432 / NCIMB 13614 / HKI 0122) TaxID=471853 RepID=C5C035_BEUC1|nr:tryptophan 2,3-dioxygenase family protein [Beutenbergia cavernae]ACQ79221.1 Tryptophan 2,3-dioxygenase [Beutenbergia cavernae DSM 12333]